MELFVLNKNVASVIMERTHSRLLLPRYEYFLLCTKIFMELGWIFITTVCIGIETI